MIITLTTDFGTSDSYVAAMKGVILGIAPSATIVDVTHHIPPQDITAAGLCLESIVSHFPDHTIHVAVVDPGVGSDRAPIAVMTDSALFVGPDNGLFTLVLDHCANASAVRLTNQHYWHTPVSNTFHGRDIFAPVAAHLANQVPLTDLGEKQDGIVRLCLPQPTVREEYIELQVIHVDRFGNLIINFTSEQFGNLAHPLDLSKVDLTADGLHITGICKTYAQAEIGEALAYFGSGGRLEIGVRNGSASERLKFAVGQKIYLSTRQ